MSNLWLKLSMYKVGRIVIHCYFIIILHKHFGIHIKGILREFINNIR